MDTNQVFQIVNTAVLPGWIILAVFPGKRWRNITIYTLALFMALVYGFYVITGFSDFNPSAFSTLAGVKHLFTLDQAVLAGWIHYLTFDLLIGNWIVNQSIRHKIKHYWVIPCLFFCFMFGPLGYLFFSLVRVFKTRSLA
ncbi:DUF4281 domain-containing protein [Fulvivirga sp. M361]|uniref:ABA4-like family protein n=1 Tax=Fulvivirga sp. M361 TaxID=2594266 RepID=UPI00117B3705|nr:ABA4-like family protein [Fulvivirga sp. M361]TRX61431.1 DUF4281 domain-containing protein [Fulvivirga sp. M361]